MKRVIYNNQIISRIIICGGRDFDNYDALEYTIDTILSQHNLNFDDVEIISGGCRGADKLGIKYAESHKILCTEFLADWKRYGKAAGPIRNSEMLDYIKDSKLPIVAAFLSADSRGTADTVRKAKGLGFDTITIDYNTEDTNMAIYAGISIDDEGDYTFDFDNDKKEDIVSLTKQNINITKMRGNVRYFGYKINQNSNVPKTPFLKWSKSMDGVNSNGMGELIDRCVEEFATNNSTEYGCIISVESNSPLVSILSEKLSEAFNSKVIDANKLDVEYLALNTELIREDLKNKDPKKVEDLIKHLEKTIVTYQKKSGSFSMTKVNPRYRKWLKPMFTISDDQLSYILDSSSILIVDDTISSGYTIQQIISLLRTAGYTGETHIFSLWNNR